MFWWILLLRAGLGAAFVVAVSTVAELIGPFWGGLLVSLPISAGPAYVMLAAQHDSTFIADSAIGSLAANAVTVVFMLTIIRLAPRAPWPVALLSAVTVWFAAALLILPVPWTLASVLALNLVTFSVCLWLTRQERRSGVSGGRSSPRRWYEMPARGLMVGVLVATVVTLSDWMGPAVTGMAAVFPIMLTGLALVALPRLGGTATAALFAATMRAMIGFALFLVVLHLTAETLGSWGGLAAAICAQLGFSLVLLGLRRAT